MLEVGRAQKTTFIARYLRLRDLQREIEEGLNVVESWNGANGELAYGKRGDMQSNRRDEQELFVLWAINPGSTDQPVDPGLDLSA